MRLVLRELEQERYGPDQLGAIKCAQNDPLAAVGLDRDFVELRAGLTFGLGGDAGVF